MEIVLPILVVGGIIYLAIQNHKLRTHIPVGVNQIQKPLEVSVEILVDEYKATKEKVEELSNELEKFSSKYEKIEEEYRALQKSTKDNIATTLSTVETVEKKVKHIEAIDEILRKQLTNINEQFVGTYNKVQINESKINDIQSQMHKVLTYKREERSY